MDATRQCSSCGRQFDDSFQFCPFDGTPLGRKCPTCGRTWDSSFQFCPLDSTALAATAAPPAAAQAPAQAAPKVEPPPTPVPASVAPAAPSPAPAAPVTAAEEAPQKPTPASFSFVEQVKPPTWKGIAFRPLTIFVTCGVVLIAFFVWYLNWKTSGPDLPLPTVSYTLLPNEGKTKGVPVVVKINQLTVFMIDDPMDSPEGAGRAKKLVATLEDTIKPLKTGATGVRFAVDDRRPILLEVTQDDTKRELATVTEGDATLAGETDPMRLAGQWAERLTDAVNLYVFGEAPKFSTGTEFGDALVAMYKAAAAATQGKVGKKALDAAYEHLTPAQRRALEAPPMARRTHARARSEKLSRKDPK